MPLASRISTFRIIVPLITTLLVAANGAGAAHKDRKPAKPDYSATLEPRTRAFLENAAAKGGPPIYTLTPEQARAVLDGVQAAPVS